MAAGAECSYTAGEERWVEWGGNPERWEAVLDRLGVEDEVWDCPHPPAAGSDRCHLHDDESEGEDAAALLRAALRDEHGVGYGAERSKQFVGGTVEGLAIADDVIRGADREQIAFVGTTFEGDCRIENVDFLADVTFERARFVGGDVRFDRSDFHGRGDVSFEGATFANHGTVSFETVDFQNEDDVTFEHAAFENPGVVTFEDADFENGGGVYFLEASFGATETVRFDDARFTEDVYFGDVFRAAEGARFVRTHFEDAELHVGSLAGTTLRRVDFRDTDLNGVDFRRCDLQGALFVRTDVRDADFRGARLDGAVFDSVTADESTRFVSVEDASGEDGWRYVFYDPRLGRDEADVDRAYRTYRTLEFLGRDCGLPGLQRWSYVNAKEMRRLAHRRAAGWSRAGIHGGLRFGYATAARTVSMYGEGVWRVFGSFGAVVLVAAAAYYVDSSGSVGPADSVYRSLLVALGVVPFEPSGWLRLVVGVEATLGAALLALLIFVLGRRTTR